MEYLKGVYLDRLILKYEKVTEEQFEKFLRSLHARQVLVKNTIVKYTIGTTIKDFHHNLNIGEGEGAIFIGYKHNSSKQTKEYNLKVEFNPSKLQDQSLHEDDVNAIQKFAFGTLNNCLKRNKRLVTGFDVAFDLTVNKSRIVPVSTTGRMQDRHKGTIYYGNRGKHGYLKIYDKKKELLEVHNREITDDDLTRIEFSFRISDGLVINDLSKEPIFRISDLYNFSFIDYDSLKGTLKACVLAYSTGLMDLREFPRHTKDNIKKALKDMEQLDLDHVLKSNWENIINDIKQYIQT